MSNIQLRVPISLTSGYFFEGSQVMFGDIETAREFAEGKSIFYRDVDGAIEGVE